jgi:hypothetical protein
MVHLILDQSYLNDAAMKATGVMSIKPTTPYDRIFILSEEPVGTAVNPFEMEDGQLFDWLDEVTGRNDHLNSHEIHLVINGMSPKLATLGGQHHQRRQLRNGPVPSGFRDGGLECGGGQPSLRGRGTQLEVRRLRDREGGPGPDHRRQAGLVLGALRPLY